MKVIDLELLEETAINFPKLGIDETALKRNFSSLLRSQGDLGYEYALSLAVTAAQTLEFDKLSMAQIVAVLDEVAWPEYAGLAGLELDASSGFSFDVASILLSEKVSEHARTCHSPDCVLQRDIVMKLVSVAFSLSKFSDELDVSFGVDSNLKCGAVMGAVAFMQLDKRRKKLVRIH